MTKSKNNLLPLLVCALTLHLKSFASLPELEEKGPEIIHHNIKGAGEFAKFMEERYIAESQGLIAVISDIDGVVTNRSTPSNVGVHSRGDMVPYLKNLIAREILVIFSSAWHKPDETFKRISSLELLNNQEKIQKGTYKITKLIKHLPVTDKELKEAENDLIWLTILKNRPSEEMITHSYSFIQKGNCISVASDFKYYRSKALSPDVFFRETSTPPQIDTLVFMEDSDLNIGIFLKQLPLTKYYSTLKKVIIFQFPGINGEIWKEDKIDPKYLTM